MFIACALFSSENCSFYSIPSIEYIIVMLTSCYLFFFICKKPVIIVIVIAMGE